MPRTATKRVFCLATKPLCKLAPRYSHQSPEAVLLPRPAAYGVSDLCGCRPGQVAPLGTVPGRGEPGERGGPGPGAPGPGGPRAYHRAALRHITFRPPPRAEARTERPQRAGRGHGRHWLAAPRTVAIGRFCRRGAGRRGGRGADWPARHRRKWRCGR